jgi:N-acetylmuramoyl-L-alanine amidase
MIEINHEFTSPNFGIRPVGIAIDTIIIHYTDMKDDISALNRLCDRQAEVSSHYLINKQGKIFSLVPDHLRAWHAGPSCWMNRHKVNDFSIGIELDNNGYEEFSSELMHSLIALCHQLIKNHPINPFYILGHSDIVPNRKFDPGRLFNWRLLANNGIGIYPEKTTGAKTLKLEEIQSMLAKYGYEILVSGIMDKQTIDVMRAFNEHFNPECYDVWSES